MKMAKLQWGGMPVYIDAGRGRRVRVHPADEQRRTIWVYLQSNGQRLAGGWTADPAEVVRAAVAWTGGAGLEETKEQAPCIEFRPWALAHEREPLGAVELAWCLKLDRIHMPPMSRFPRVHALMAAAYAEPLLRRLMPVTSHHNLWFSTSTTARYNTTRVGYMIWPHDEGSYGVRNRSELLSHFKTPEEAVAYVVAVLPEGIGPAR
jgi:hypothetical protein